MTKILLIDGVQSWLDALIAPLEQDGHQVFISADGSSGLKIAWQEMPELVILNLHLPTADGFQTCRRLREIGVPLILVSSPHHDEQSVVKALEMGADDYLRAPIEMPILLAKLRTLMRRNDKSAANRLSVYKDEHLLVDLESRRVQVEGKPVKLTPTEFRLLSILMRRAGRVVTHEELIKEIWGTEKDTSLGSLKLYIHYLRRKIETTPKKPYYLLAEWGIGYRFREIQINSASRVS